MNTALSQLDPADYDLFQIDDGWEPFIGDWLEASPEKFPGGMKRPTDCKKSLLFHAQSV